MSRLFSICILLLSALPSFLAAQQALQISVRDSATTEPLIGAQVQVVGTQVGAITNDAGIATIKNPPSGARQLRISYLGYRTLVRSVQLPLAQLAIVMQSEGTEVEGITVSSLRTGSRIEDAPIKIEVLGQEDMNEENTIKPGNIASILGDLSVINIQQTSAVSGNMAVRLQGLDAKYTQILRDGLPLYDGFSGSFGILQIPPLDLQQIEIIKGSVSTLYGGGAIAGMINTISKQPLPDSTEASFTLSQSSLQETNLNAYIGRRWSKFGFTMFGGINRQEAVDVGNAGFSVVPQLRQYNLHPRLFYYFNDKTTLNAGYQLLAEDRLGGSMAYLRGDSAANFFQRNVSVRHVGDAKLVHTLKGGSLFTVKGTYSWFARGQNTQEGTFGARQTTGFLEASYAFRAGLHQVVLGSSSTADQLTVQSPDSAANKNYTYNTLGIFAQDDWNITDKFTLEAGLRYDYHNVYGSFFLPRIALLYKFTSTLLARLSSGLGYKVPITFSQQTLNQEFRLLQPLATGLKSERSFGINADINYSTAIGEVVLTLNQSFYYTRIENPLVLSQPAAPLVSLQNAGYVMNSLGTDTYVRGSYRGLEVYLGYNHTTAQNNAQTFNSFVAFSPQDKFSATVFYERNHWRGGIEASYIANQYITPLNDYLLRVGGADVAADTRVPTYWLIAAMLGKTWHKFTIVLNCENLLDVRQQRYSPVVLGSSVNPIFRPLWAPIDGRVANLILRVQL